MRPARLPVPPSRPGRSRVAGQRIRASQRIRRGLAALLALSVAACTGGLPPRADPSRPTIAYLFDGSPPDAELVSASALAGVELAAHEAGAVEIEPVNLGLDRTEVMSTLGALAEDSAVVAAVIAPWTAPPAGAIDLLAAHGLPVVSLSWAWGPPSDGDGVWLSLAAGRAQEAVLLLSTADVAPEDATLCLAGDEHPTSRALLATAAELARAAGDPDIVMAGTVAEGDVPIADPVADRIEEERCPVLAWTGGTTGAEALLSRLPESPALVVGASRIGTDDGLALATAGRDVITVCACVSVNLSLEPDHMRFVHDLQAASGAPPGPYSVEAYDAGRFLVDLVAGAGSDDPRGILSAALEEPAEIPGLAGSYRFEADGSRAPETLRVGAWRATGSRWLPVEPLTGAPA
ncbi:MAG TPA: ABC transporter substrate-binding protein [Actinomycetota bacterium]